MFGKVFNTSLQLFNNFWNGILKTEHLGQDSYIPMHDLVRCFNIRKVFFCIRILVQISLDGRIGIFPSWTAVYSSVVVATLVMILLLYWFTVALDFSGS